MLTDFHENFAWFVIAANGLAGVWSLSAQWITGLRMRSLWWLVAVAQTLIFAEIGLGIGIIASRDIQIDTFHVFYGGLCVLSVGILYSYRHQLAPKRWLLYGLGSLFIMGLAIRALSVAG